MGLFCQACVLVDYAPIKGTPQVAELGCVTNDYAPKVTIKVWSLAPGFFER